MADSVARRPHTATSVSGLISPPSPIPVVCLPVMFFFFFPSSSQSPTIAQYNHSNITFVCLSPGFHLITCIFSLLDPSAIPHLLAYPPFRLVPSPALSSIPPSSLAACSSQAARSSPEHFAFVLMPLILCRCLFLG